MQDKVILLTGGTYSFGKNFTEMILKDFNPKAIRIFSRRVKTNKNATIIPWR